MEDQSEIMGFHEFPEFFETAGKLTEHPAESSVRVPPQVVLLHFGGLYLDMDTRALTAAEEWLRDEDELVVAEAPWSVAEWAVAPRFDNPRATVPVLVLG